MRDTVVIRERVRDTVVKVEPDSAALRALLECDSLGRVQLKKILSLTEGARLPPPEVKVEDNVLTALSRADSMDIYLKLLSRDTTRIRRETVVETVEVNRLTGWQTLWMRLGQLLAAAAGIVLLIKMIKR